MHCKVIQVAAGLLLLSALASAALDPEDYEEPAGPGAGFQLNPADEIYGLSVGYGIWLKETPVFADYFGGAFWNGIEDGWYGGLGVTFRLMPHGRIAPFVGVGGSYNLGLSSTASVTPEEDLPDRGQSYWSGHAESGIRFWLPWRYRFLELTGRYTVSSLEGDRDYWLAGIGMGVEP
jgi:hypothetical protein